MKKTKEQKGITLVALIITIIILLILAVVTINAIKGDRIINYAKNVKDSYNEAQSDEEDKLLKYKYELAKADGSTIADSYEEYKLEEKYKLKIGDKVNYIEGTNGTYTTDSKKHIYVGSNTPKEFDPYRNNWV